MAKPPLIYSFRKFGDKIRPMIPVLITNPHTGQTFKTYALLDTGADANCFPAFVPNSTGHNLKHPDVKTDINMGLEGHKTTTWKHTFTISLLDPATLTNILWTSPSQLVNCVDHDKMPPLLGTVGFLENLRITFNYKSRKILIEFP